MKLELDADGVNTNRDIYTLWYRSDNGDMGMVKIIFQDLEAVAEYIRKSRDYNFRAYRWFVSKVSHALSFEVHLDKVESDPT